MQNKNPIGKWVMGMLIGLIGILLIAWKGGWFLAIGVYLVVWGNNINSD